MQELNKNYRRGALRWSEAEIGAQGLSPDVGLIMAVGAEAKTMTSLLNIPTVLAVVYFFIESLDILFFSQERISALSALLISVCEIIYPKK